MDCLRFAGFGSLGVGVVVSVIWWPGVYLGCCEGFRGDFGVQGLAWLGGLDFWFWYLGLLLVV